MAGKSSMGEEGLRLPPLVRTVDASALIATPHPVSWNQSQLLTAHLVDGAAAAYNIPTSFWLHGPLSAVALRGALAALVERHAVLRTTYEVADEGGFAQRVRSRLAKGALLREVVAADEAEAEALVAADALAGFELLGADGGVLRCTLARVEDAEAPRHLLLINVHHVAFDGGSSGVLLGELGALYRTLSAGGGVEEAALPPLSARYSPDPIWSGCGERILVM